MQKRGQAAMEFLMTYGWAILVVLIVMGGLYYLGIFDSEVATTCNLEPPLSCQETVIDEQGVTIKVGLAGGYIQGTVTSMNINGEPCDNIIGNTLESGEINSIRCVKTGLTKGEGVTLDIITNVRKTTGLNREVTGYIQGEAEEIAVLKTGNLVAHYSFEGNADDQSGTGNDATMQGTVPFITGRVGQAASFDGGSTNYFRAPMSTTLNVKEEVTISTWINPDLTPENPQKDKSFLDTKYQSDTNGGLALKILSPLIGGGGDIRNILFAADQNGAGNTGWFQEGIENGLIQGEWHHLAVTFKPTQVKLYIDGELNGTYSTTVSDITTTGSYLYIGRYAGGDAGYNYKGYLDELMIFNKALSESEIQILASY